MVSIAYIAGMYQSSVVIHIHKMELIKFEIRVLLETFRKQDYKAAAAAQRMCQVERKGVVSESMA